MNKNQVYEFKKEFCKELNIPVYQVERRFKDLLEWLKNFFDYEFYNGKPKRILIKEIIGEYQPLPRKLPSQEALTAEKKKDYQDFTIASLGVDFKPNSQARVARNAINFFGYEKYHHTNVEAVTKRYIKEPFKAHGESDNKKVWVWYSTYEIILPEVLEDWRKILNEEHIAETEAANAFYRQEQGQDISKEKQYYKNAQERFKKKYNDIPVLVTSWKLKKEIDKNE